MVVHLHHRLKHPFGTIGESNALTQAFDELLSQAIISQWPSWLRESLLRASDTTNADFSIDKIGAVRRQNLPSQISENHLHPANSLPCDRIVLGVLEGAGVQALVDTCAENLVTERFVVERQISYDRDAFGCVQVADGTSMPTIGTVTLHWRFRGEGQLVPVRFHVISAAYRRYPVVLGGAFLWSSGTLTEHTMRLKIRSRGSPRSQIFLQGSGHLRLSGVCEGRLVEMFPDLASDIPAMSTGFAREIGAVADTSASSQIVVEIPGDRTIMTRGKVTDVRLQFEEDVYEQAFYLIDGLPGAILLDAEFLMRTNAFVTYRDLITVTHQVEDDHQGVFLGVAKKREGSRFGKKTPMPTPREQNQADWKKFMLERTGKREKLKEELAAIKSELSSATDPAERYILEQCEKEAEENLVQDAKDYTEKYEEYRKKNR